MELEKIKKKFDSKEYDFFYKLMEQLDTELYFIGSITRNDYIKGKSDFDIEVFAENVPSIKYKVEHLLNYHYKNKDPKYIVFEINGIPVSGYKYSFKNDDIRFDFTIYRKNTKELLLHQRHIDSNIPFVLGIFLRIVKYIYYYLNIINRKQYTIFKKRLWVFHNNEKTMSKSYDKEKYINYLKKENINKKYLIDYLMPR